MGITCFYHLMDENTLQVSTKNGSIIPRLKKSPEAIPPKRAFVLFIFPYFENVP